MVLGNMDIGISTANLVGIAVVFLLAFLNIFGTNIGSMIQNVFTSAKGLSLAALVVLGFTVGRNPVAWAANFGSGLHEFWRNAGWSTLHPVQVGVGGPIVLVNLLVILAVVQTGSLFSADAWNNITFTAGEVKNPKRNIPLSLVLGTGFVLTVYFLASRPTSWCCRCMATRMVRRYWRGACSMRRKIAWARQRWSRFFRPGARC
jgi:APA family basic amino acid/polyamine antiporter